MASCDLLLRGQQLACQEKVSDKKAVSMLLHAPFASLAALLRPLQLALSFEEILLQWIMRRAMTKETPIEEKHELENQPTTHFGHLALLVSEECPYGILIGGAEHI